MMKRSFESDENLKKVRTDSEYYASYEDPEIHRLMIQDKPRTEAYRNAILNNKHLFHGKTCLDVGAGSGILSLFMAEAGAKLVHAVEASAMSRLIPMVASANAYDNVICVHHCRVEDAPIKKASVDIIVSEWMGFYLFHESMLKSVLFARDNYLNDYGLIFPTEFKLYAAPCSLESIKKEKISFWEDVYGFDMKAVKKYANKLICSKPHITIVNPNELLGDPVLVRSFNINECDTNSLEFITKMCFTGITNSGNYLGLCVWFDCTFIPLVNFEPEINGVKSTLSTSPHAPPTHWKQTVIVFDRTKSESIIEMKTDQELQNVSEEQTVSEETNTLIDNCEVSKPGEDKEFCKSVESTEVLDYFVEEDEVVGWKFELLPSKENPRHFNIMVELLDAEDEEHPLPCTCPMVKCQLISKLLENEEESSEEES